MTEHMCSVTEEEPGMFAVSCDSCDLHVQRGTAQRAGAIARRHEQATDTKPDPVPRQSRYLPRAGTEQAAEPMPARRQQVARKGPYRPRAKAVRQMQARRQG